MNNERGVIRTKMSAAFIRALDECIIEGRNPGRVGRHIRTAEAAGKGVKYTPRKPQSKAVIA